MSNQLLCKYGFLPRISGRLCNAFQATRGHQHSLAGSKPQDQKQSGWGGGGPCFELCPLLTPPGVRTERDWVENLSGPILPARKGNWSPEWRLCCLRSHSKSMAVPGFEPGSFDSWFSAPSMLLPWSSGKSESDMDAQHPWLSRAGRRTLHYLPLSGHLGGAVGPRQRALQSWSVSLSGDEGRGGELKDGMLAWHGLGPRTAGGWGKKRFP